MIKVTLDCLGKKIFDVSSVLPTGSEEGKQGRSKRIGLCIKICIIKKNHHLIRFFIKNIKLFNRKKSKNILKKTNFSMGQKS